MCNPIYDEYGFCFECDHKRPDTMRKLQEITDAARRGEPATEDELRFAVCAYDVFVAQLELDKDPKQLAKFFVAAESDPRGYIGEANDPTRADVQAWHGAFINVGR